MRKFLFIILFSFSIAHSDIFDRNPSWYPPEKYHQPLHIGISSMLVVGTYYTYRYFDQKSIHERVQRLLYPISDEKKFRYLAAACITSLAIGYSKELVDAFHSGKFNTQDMEYNFLGMLLGASFTYTVNFDFLSGD